MAIRPSHPSHPSLHPAWGRLGTQDNLAQKPSGPQLRSQLDFWEFVSPHRRPFAARCASGMHEFTDPREQEHVASEAESSGLTLPREGIA